MRIQHNIMAMNAYRNLGMNNKSLAGNLEKLSSGYKINRAGDDAAGLAISEKMRAQITALDAAQKNVNDGISLVKTAEGAMQEIQDMLNRMEYLATQSANGTYDNDVDRNNLQKEMDALKTEINRIADASNFNGTKLLNGDLAAPTVETTAGADAVKAVYEFDLSGWSAGNLVLDGKTINWDTDKATSIAAVAANADSTNYDWSVSGEKLTITAKTGGKITTAPSIGTATGTGAAVEKTKGAAATGAKTEVDFTDMTGEDAIGGTIKLGNTEYKLVETGKGSGTDGAVGTNEIAINRNDNAAAIAQAIADNATATGYTLDVDGDKLTITNDTTGKASTALSVSTSNIGGLTLQIGDTSDSHNQMTVMVGDMHTNAMGTKDGLSIADIKIDTQLGASEAVKVIKDAINYVSGIRGDLGAIQNRLEHTNNNLAVMEENIQDAESTIRDTDIADEMMAYTKNNILIQSAQAMLAQANQVPQGVLQLMQ